MQQTIWLAPGPARAPLTKLGGAPLPCGDLAGRVERALKEWQPRTERCGQHRIIEPLPRVEVDIISFNQENHLARREKDGASKKSPVCACLGLD
jgi:hypothetical protein